MDDFILIYLLAGVLLVMGSLPFLKFLGLIMTRKSVDVFEPIYASSLYFCFIFGIRSVYALQVGTIFLGEPPFDPETRKAWIIALLYSILAIGVFFVGYYLPLGPRLVRALPALSRDWTPSRLLVVVLALSLLGLMGLIGLVQSLGGPEVYLNMKHYALAAAGTTYFYQFLSCLWIATVVGYMSYLRLGWPRIVVWLLAAATMLVNASTGSKGLVLFPVVSLMLVHHYLRGSIKLRVLGYVVLIGVAITPAFNTYRSSSSINEIIFRSIDIFLNPDLLITHVISRFHGMDALITIVRDTPQVWDFQLGATLAPLLTAWIPRAIWLDKPVVSFGKVFGETYWAQFFAGTGTAPSPTVIGEAYINFHIAGIVWIGFLSGVALRAIYGYLIEKGGLSGLLVYSVIYPFLVMFWESDIVGLVTRGVFTLVLTAVTGLVLGRGRGGRGAAGSRGSKLVEYEASEDGV